MIETEYANTDLDILSPVAFDVLNAELSATCCQLHYAQMDGGGWTASYEANRLNTDAPSDIGAFLSVINALSDKARSQLSACSKRDFNIGFHCGDNWAYNYELPNDTIAAVGLAGFSVSVTLYPARNPDGTSKLDQNGR